MMTQPRTGIHWKAIDAVIFDVDGTLFDHLALRGSILVKLLRNLLTNRLHLRDIQILRKFRSERVRLALAEVDNIDRRQFEEVARALGRSSNEVKELVVRWIYHEPLAFVPRHAFADANRFIMGLRERGIRTGVFSDYPADEKLALLATVVDIVRDATSPDIGRLKPNPQGFIRVAELLGVRPERCLIVGDRDDRDGEAARRGGFEFLKKISERQRPKTREFRRYIDLIHEIEIDCPRELVG